MGGEIISGLYSYVKITTPPSTQEIIRKQHNRSSRQASAEIHSALLGGANHRSDGQTRPKLDYY